MSGWMKALSDGLAEKIANKAQESGQQNVARNMRLGRSRKRAQEEQAEKRKYTMFRSSIVNIIP